MHLLKTFPGFFILFFPLIVQVTNSPDELIKWRADRKLSWKDYYGKPDPGSDAAAITYTSLGFNYSIEGTSFHYRITCSFSKSKSWVRIKNDHLLSHEQAHFDIAEIFARRLNKAMHNYRFDTDTYEEDLDMIFDSILKESKEMQERYDYETDFSRDREQQKNWIVKIEKALKDLNRFSDY